MAQESMEFVDPARAPALRVRRIMFTLLHDLRIATRFLARNRAFAIASASSSRSASA
jgi:hypothetical protein